MKACLWGLKSARIIQCGHLRIKIHFFKNQNRSNIITHFICRISLQMMFIYLQKLGLSSKKEDFGASLVAQWLRICLPMQGTRVRALVWEHPTCRGATRPVSHNY